ncbi:hypothetical protein ABZ208_35445 [Streptomyces sp. NPDC006208]|uniref:hypothetical protein n=1 Tax=Streptomyces sp. NPDC006208 TaxID=3156734 RepID=UPI0033B2B43A
MSDLEKAARDAVDAADNTQQLALIAAFLQAQQLTQQQGCQHPPPAPVQQASNGKWVALAISGPFLMVTLAISVMAFAISAVALTICVLVLRSMWVDIQKGKKR